MKEEDMIEDEQNWLYEKLSKILMINLVFTGVVGTIAFIYACLK